MTTNICSLPAAAFWPRMDANERESFLAFSLPPHFLQTTHFVDDSLKNPLQRVPIQRTRVVLRYIPKDRILAFWLIHRQIDALLHLADPLHHARSPVKQ